MRVYIRKNRSVRFAALLLSLSLLLVGCSGLFATPIKKILDNPRDYSDKPVRISGEVAGVFSLFVVKYFVVKDKTGEIIVDTKRPMPTEGTKVTINGKVHEAFSLGEKQLIVIVENEEKQP
jgi:hypothetical protein